MPTTHDPAWTSDTLANPHVVGDKARRVQAMFAAIAPSYDLNNRVHSLGRDQSWRRAAVRAAALHPADRVLDVACGTGDLTILFARELARLNPHQPPPPVTGLDFTYPMLRFAEHKARDLRPAPAAPLRWLNGDAMNLPLPDRAFDVLSIAFGIRNVADPAAALRQFHRVLRPGGRLLILEFSLPESAPLRALYLFYFRHILPRSAALIARDRSGAYRYLPQSVNTFMGRQAMVDQITSAGFAQVTVKPLTFGIAVLYRAVRPA